MLKLDAHPAAVRFLESLPPKQYRQVMRKVFALMDEPRPQDAKALHGLPCLRADAGEYRIVYEIAGDLLRLVTVGKRNDTEVYRGLR